MLRLATLLFLFTTAFARADVVISEFLAENDDGIADVDGDNSDWVELFNNGPASVDLTGWRLTDDSQAPAKWQFPAVSLAAGQRLVVFASGKDRRIPGSELHTNFSLNNAAGGYLALRRPDGSLASEYANYPQQRGDISFGDGTLVDGQDLITATSTGKFLIPTNDTLGTTWTAQAFSDTAWTATTSRLGYQTGASGAGAPIASWTFDDVLTNEIPGAPDAELRNGATYSAITPSALGGGKSIQFNRASQQYVSASLDVSETSLSTSFWFRTTQTTTGMFNVTSGDLGAGGYDRLVYLSGGNIFVRTWDTEVINSTGKNYSDGQWHHCVHVLGAAAGGQRIYVDGILVAQGVKPSSQFTWQNRINIGHTPDAGTAFAYHDGQIDDVAIWSEVLNPTAVSQLFSGTPPGSISGYSAHISTNVESQMRNVGSSLYLRLPFTVSRPTPFNTAKLRVRYDDGFIAYIDGVPVASRNAPASPAFNSTATTDRLANDALIEETIDISAHAALLANGTHVLAIHSLNDSAASSDFLFNATLTAATETPATGIYMDPPTPGTANNTGFAGFVADTIFTPKRGFLTTATGVVITCATPGATIAYTLDGTDPSPTNGTQVPAPNANTPPSTAVYVTANKYIRAIAYKNASGLRTTNVDSHTYLFMSQILTQSITQPGYPTSWAGRTADYAMDPNVVNTTLPGYSIADGINSLPSISMTAPIASLFGTAAPVGIYYDTNQRGDAAERKISIEWINPDGSPGWHVQCGTRPHGNSSRGHGFTPKHPLRLNFRSEYGWSRLRENLFGGGVKKFNQLLLRACSTDSMPVIDGNVEDGEERWNNDKATYMRDQYMRNVLNDLGHPNCRGRYVHLFINGLYWGIYNIAERPTADFFADTFGGEKSEWDILKDFTELDSGEAAAWNEMTTIVNDTAITDATRCQKLLGNNPDGTRNPAYPIYIHWPSFRDYMIAHIAAGAEDWPDHNYWVGRRRGPLSEGFRFVAWDQEISNDSLTRTSGRGSAAPFERAGDPTLDAAFTFGPAKIYDKFRRVEPFKSEFRERIHALLFNNGALTPTSQKARWAALQSTLDKAIVPESARWGDANGEGAKKRETTWLNNMNYMNATGTGYWDAIHPIDVQRFRNVQLYPSINQPTYSQHGGIVPTGYQLYLTHPEPLIYYTLDGSDPMAPNGTPAPGTLTYSGGLTTENPIPAASAWKYLVTPGAPIATWRNIAFNDTAWATGAGQLGYGDGDETTVIGYGTNPASRYNTTYFRKTFTITNKATIQSARALILRDDGAVVHLNGAELGRTNMHPTNVIAYTTTALTNVTGVDETSLYYEINIPVANLIEGTNVLAVEIHKSTPSEDDLSFDGRVEITRSNAASGIVLNNSGFVKTRARTAAGEWSGLNTAYFTIGTQPPTAANIVFSEIHYHPAAPSRPAELAISSDADMFEYIELHNISGTTVDFTGASLGSGVLFAFPSGFTLPAGARCIVAKNPDAIAARHGTGLNIAGVFADDGNGQTGLSNGGDTITLAWTNSSNVTTTLRTCTYDDTAPWPTAADGNGPSLVLKNPTSNPDHNLPTNWIASADSGGTPAQSPTAQTFQNWRTVFSDTLAPAADGDHDGIPNALEYALVLNPLVRNGPPITCQLITDGAQTYPSITFRRRAAADLTLTVETSADLATWGTAPSVLPVSTTDHGDGTTTEIWRTATPANSEAKQYLRLKAVVQ